MTTKHRWLVLVLAAALFASALAPASALAGKNDRSTDLPGSPGEDPNPMQYGDPDPVGGGSPQLVGSDQSALFFVVLRDWLRWRFVGLPVSDAMQGGRMPSRLGVSNSRVVQ